jgi:hypothetical protein
MDENEPKVASFISLRDVAPPTQSQRRNQDLTADQHAAVVIQQITGGHRQFETSGGVSRPFANCHK